MTILIASTDESAGKTAVALALAEALDARGDRVGYMKPTGTRLDSTDGTLDGDPLLARDLLGLDDGIPELEPVVYSPQFVEKAIRGREDPGTLREQVRERFERLSADADRMIVEGSGSLSTGGVVGLTDADIADLLEASVVLVAPYEEPGDIDAVLAAADGFGDRLSGVLFNAVPDSAFDTLASDVVPFLEGRGIRVYGTVPRDAALAGVSVAELADELGADLLTSETPTDGLVQRFVVGAMSAGEWLGGHNRGDDAVLVTGGDRTDLQTAALETSELACLLVTDGKRPRNAVLGRAEDEGLPVLLVGTDTRTTLDRAETVVRSGRTRDAETVARMGELLRDYADVDAMIQSSDE